MVTTCDEFHEVKKYLCLIPIDGLFAVCHINWAWEEANHAAFRSKKDEVLRCWKKWVGTDWKLGWKLESDDKCKGTVKRNEVGCKVKGGRLMEQRPSDQEIWLGSLSLWLQKQLLQSYLFWIPLCSHMWNECMEEEFKNY
jgi:hypothetical protein